MTTTAANVHDANVLGQLLHGKETRFMGIRRIAARRL
jgi:IS5 family transposase